jgi:Rrf2 family transcriptional regulator, cysteine metabolism repressor
MSLSQKCYYAIRAVFELAQAPAGRAVKIGEIAERQGIPPKFLEAILNQLKGGGFVESRRGADGGYLLARSPRLISMGDVLRFVEGPLHPVKCVGGRAEGETALDGVLAPIWDAAEKALADVYDGITFQDLVDRSRPKSALDFAI